MAEKGAREKFYDLALRMYAEGKSLTDIEGAVGVSRQTLSKWKADTLVPGEERDQWDKARAHKGGNLQRLRALFDRELRAVEESPAGSISAVSLDAITKLGTLVQRYEASEAVGGGYDRAQVFLENLHWLAGWLREHDPEGLKVLAKNFDDLTLAFKTEILSGNTDA